MDFAYKCTPSGWYPYIAAHGSGVAKMPRSCSAHVNTERVGRDDIALNQREAPLGRKRGSKLLLRRPTFCISRQSTRQYSRNVEQTMAFNRPTTPKKCRISIRDGRSTSPTVRQKLKQIQLILQHLRNGRKKSFGNPEGLKRKTASLSLRQAVQVSKEESSRKNSTKK